MPESIRSFGRVLSHEAGRRMAIVANRNGAMARLDPAAVMLAHHVAIRARCRIVGQIRAAFGVNKRISAKSSGEAKRYAENDAGQSEFVHEILHDKNSDEKPLMAYARFSDKLKLWPLRTSLCLTG